MSPPAVHPLLLSELLWSVASYVQPRDYYYCSLVCKAWNTSFNALIWDSCVVDHSIDVHSPISAETMRSHAHLIRTLTHRGPIPLEYLLIQYPNLKTLRIHAERLTFGEDKKYDAKAAMEMWLGVAVLIRDASTLTTVELSPNRCVLANRVWNSIEDNPTVTTLRLNNLDINYERQARIFWKACTTLETLEMEHCFVYSRRRSNGCVPDSFPRMKEIKLQDFRLRSGNLIRTMANSPQLSSFFWRGGQTQEWFRLREIQNGLEATTGFLNLESLDLLSSNFTDIDISQIIRGMKKPIVKLGLVKTGVGSLTIAALGPHLRTIQELDFRDCYQMKSSDIIVFLRSCPNLTSFKAGTLHASDMGENERWACADNLRVLCVHIRVSLDEVESRYVFACLSKLTLLQEFDIARYGYAFLSADDIIKRPLQLRLNCGLGQLSTLSRMERLSFGTSGQAMTMDEGLWIKKHWRRLKTIQGRFSVDNRSQESLRRLFREEAKPNPARVTS